MKNFKIEYAIGIFVVGLLLVGSLFIYQQQTKNYKKMMAQESAARADKKVKKADLDKLPLPQLSDKVSSEESIVVLKTSEGNIKMKLFNKYTPLAVENFMTHAKDGYYNGTKFHRVLDGFMIQGGDPKENGTGGESIWRDKDMDKDSGKGFKNEVSRSLYNIRGAVSMANAGPNTNGSQFFINQNQDDQAARLDKNVYPQQIWETYKKGGNPALDGGYTVFGQVIDGMDVVDKIAAGKVKNGDSGEKSTPENPVKITGAEIEQEGQVK